MSAYVTPFMRPTDCPSEGPSVGNATSFRADLNFRLKVSSMSHVNE